MSDFSQGPGWWQASDGKWYPPESHPQYVAPAPQAPAPEPRAAPPVDAPPAFDYAPPTGPPTSGPPAAATAPQPAGPAPDGGSKKPPWWIAVAAVAGIAAIVGAIFVFTGGDDDDTSASIGDLDTPTPTVEADAPVTEAPPTEAPVSEPTPETPTTEPTEPPEEEPTAAPVAGGGAGTVDDPFSIADAEPFTYRSSFGTTTWEGSITGVIEVEIDSFDEEISGRCYLVLGLLTPTTLDQGIVNNSFDTPTIGVLTDGAYTDAGGTDCAHEAAEAAGWQWILFGSVTEGTSYPFYEELLIEDPVTETPDLLVVGDPRDEGSIYYEVSLIDDYPDPVLTVGDPVAAGNDLLPVGSGADSSFEFMDDFSTTGWSGSISAIVELDVDRFDDAPGTCVAILGELTPTEIGDGTVTSGFDTPPVGLISEGRLYESAFGDCATEPLEDAGYGWIFDAEVSVGTSYPFYNAVFIPEDEDATIDVVVLGRPAQDLFLLYEATLSDEIPTP